MNLGFLGVVAIGLTLLAGIRWPGALIAGCFFTYQAGAAADMPWIGMAYVAAAAAILLFKAARSPAKTSFVALDGALLALVAALVLSIGLARDPGQLVGDAATLVVAVGGMYAVGRFAPVTDRGFAMQVLIATVVLGAVLAAVLLTQRATATAGELSRLYLADKEASAVGLSQPFPLALFGCAVLAILARTRQLWLLASVCAAVVLYAALISATRGVFVALALGILTFLALTFKRDTMTRMAVVLVFAVCSGIAAIELLPADQVQASTDRLFGIVFQSQSGLDPSARERVRAWDAAMELFLQRPLTGHGYGAYAHLTPWSYPHNMFLEVMVAAGLFALALLIGWVVAFCTSVAKARTRNITLAAIIAGFAAVSFVHMQISFGFFMGKPLFLMSALIASLAASNLPHGASKPSTRSNRRPLRQMRPAFRP